MALNLTMWYVSLPLVGPDSEDLPPGSCTEHFARKSRVEHGLQLVVDRLYVDTRVGRRAALDVDGTEGRRDDTTLRYFSFEREDGPRRLSTFTRVVLSSRKSHQRRLTRAGSPR